ncbi:MAG: hypothetical protein GY756_23900, partial [bacterium]|nr:hypothetical protein [bacterium]
NDNTFTDLISEEDLIEKINKIYSPANLKWDILVNDAVSYDYLSDADATFEVNFPDNLRAYTMDMSAVINALKKSDNAFDNSTYYIFIVNNPKEATRLGYMPRGLKFGCVFIDKHSTGDKLARTIAQKLAQGTFAMDYQFNEYPEISNDLENLMSYHETSVNLNKYQWNKMRTPVEYEEETDINSLYVTFEEFTGQDYGFDDIREGITPDALKKLYKKSDKITQTEYRIPWKSAASTGEIDKVHATIHSGTVPDNYDLVFENSLGDILTYENTQQANIKAVNVTATADCEVYAYAKNKNNSEDVKLLGALNVVAYAPPEENKNIVIVPVNNNNSGVSAGQLEDYLNNCYGKAVMKKFKVSLYSKGITFNEYQEDQFNAFPPKEFKYTPDMWNLLEKFKKENTDFDENKYYIFLLKEPKNGNQIGLMPFFQPFGFIFTDKVGNTEELKKAIAHELGHGIFGLEHKFIPGDGDNVTGTVDYTDNLMCNHKTSSYLYERQWEDIQNPVCYLDGGCEAERAAMMVAGKSFYITLTGDDKKYLNNDKIFIVGNPTIEFNLFTLKSNGEGKVYKTDKWKYDGKDLTTEKIEKYSITLKEYDKYKKLEIICKGETLIFEIYAIKPYITIPGSYDKYYDNSTIYVYGEPSVLLKLFLKESGNRLGNNVFLQEYIFDGTTYNKNKSFDNEKLTLNQPKKVYTLKLKFKFTSIEIKINSLPAPIVEIVKKPNTKYEGYGFDNYNYKQYDNSIPNRYKQDYVETIDGNDYSVPYITAIQPGLGTLLNLHYQIPSSLNNKIQYDITTSATLDIFPDITIKKGQTEEQFELKMGFRTTSGFVTVEIRDRRGNLKGKFKIMIENSNNFEVKEYIAVTENDFGTTTSIPQNFQSNLDKSYEQALTKWTRTNTRTIRLANINILAMGFSNYTQQTNFLKKTHYTQQEYLTYLTLIWKYYKSIYGIQSENIVIFSNKTVGGGTRGSTGTGAFRKFSTMFSGATKVTVAHELGHGINLNHIWESNVLNNPAARTNTKNYMSYNPRPRYTFWKFQWTKINPNIR